VKPAERRFPTFLRIFWSSTSPPHLSSFWIGGWRVD